jgi:hypothetical protein
LKQEELLKDQQQMWTSKSMMDMDFGPVQAILFRLEGVLTFSEQSKPDHEILAVL